jgi:hypothetical protein
MKIVAIILFTMVSTTALVRAKTCECGNACGEKNGIITEDETCVYVAELNKMYGRQFVVSDSAEEAFLVDQVLAGNPSSLNLHVSTDASHVFERFSPSCLSPNCTATVYVNDCVCELNFFEAVVERITYFYEHHNKLFWIALSVLFVLIAIAIIKCLCC